MRGHVRKRGATWSAVYDEPGENGKRRQRWRGGFATKREAEAFLATTLNRLGDGSYVAPAKVTLATYLEEEWLPAIVDTVRPLTYGTYRSMVRTHIVPGLGQRRLQTLTGGTLSAFYQELGRQGLAPASRRLIHAVLHRALKDAVRWGKLTRNPAEQADAPARDGSRAQAWTAGELARFLEHAARDRLFALWRLGALSGMRRGELLGLTWRSLDTEAGALTVTQQLVPSKGGCAFGPPKSERGARMIALDPGTFAALVEHREGQLVERTLAGDAYEDGDLVYCDELGRPIRPERLTYRFGQLRRGAEIPSGTLHTLRHTAATLMLVHGIPVHVVAARLGDDPRTVLDRYAHLLPRSDREAAEQMAAVLPR
jgi:integrase